MNLLESIMSHPTARDKQRKIGPSTMGSLCAKCVAEALASHDTEPQRGRYWAGAAIGTAIHHYVEERVPEVLGDLFLPEIKVTIGEIPGYGWIKGTADGVLKPNSSSAYPVDKYTCVDWKSSDTNKLRFIRQAFLYPPEETDPTKLKEARFKVQGYIGQTHLYCRGLVAAGVPVEQILIGFVARDAKTSDDFWEVTFPYDSDYAEKVWNRVVYIWQHLDENEWLGHEHCFVHGGSSSFLK